MRISPLDFIRSAEKMLEIDLEINDRNAASRAYQGAYHACKQLKNALDLKPLTTAPEQEESPKNLARSLIQIPLPRCKNQHWDRTIQIRQLGHLLSNARDMRHSADHDLDLAFSRKKALQLILSCHQIVLRAEELLQELN
ncbi:MAG: hypothetical protein HQL67_10355 [Magnetococcales bacterium]|nr:hypothetical protein [Magnetococcales bacterium]